MPNPTREEIAWAAGLFEGEGCIRSTAKSSVELTIQMTDLDVLERFAEVVGVGKVLPVRVLDPTRIHRKPRWYWKITAAPEVRRILTMFMPWFCIRRGAKAQEAMERLKNNHGWNGHKTHCIRGHPLSGYNLFLPKYGGRQCRECRNRNKRLSRVRLAG